MQKVGGVLALKVRCINHVTNVNYEDNVFLLFHFVLGLVGKKDNNDGVVLYKESWHIK